MAHEVFLSRESIGDDSRVNLESGEQLLSSAELRKANAYRFPVHRNRYIRGRALLRTKLASLLHQDAGEIEIREGKWGKPFVPESDVSFNLSHSGDLAIFAFSNSLLRVGVDLEHLDRETDIEGLSQHCFTPTECRELQALSPLERSVLFFKIWTAKEARMKLTGEGLSLDPKAIELSFSKGVPCGFQKPSPGGEILELLEYSQHQAVGAIVADEPFKILPLR